MMSSQTIRAMSIKKGGCVVLIDERKCHTELDCVTFSYRMYVLVLFGISDGQTCDAELCSTAVLLLKPVDYL